MSIGCFFSGRENETAGKGKKETRRRQKKKKQEKLLARAQQSRRSTSRRKNAESPRVEADGSLLKNEGQREKRRGQRGARLLSCVLLYFLFGRASYFFHDGPRPRFFFFSSSNSRIHLCSASCLSPYRSPALSRGSPYSSLNNRSLLRTRCRRQSCQGRRPGRIWLLSPSPLTARERNGQSGIRGSFLSIASK